MSNKANIEVAIKRIEYVLEKCYGFIKTNEIDDDIIVFSNGNYLISFSKKNANSLVVEKLFASPGLSALDNDVLKLCDDLSALYNDLDITMTLLSKEVLMKHPIF